jgi:NTP pyrophosphatase (non-canonical NTP hydrolase)
LKQQVCNDFQEVVAAHTIRHKSILDILTKTQECTSRVNRAVIKSVTNCGCVKINAEKKEWPTDITLKELDSYLDSHLLGDLCPECQEVITEEVGKLLFYVTALCNTLGLKLNDVIAAEQSKVLALGKFNLT